MWSDQKCVTVIQSISSAWTYPYFFKALFKFDKKFETLKKVGMPFLKIYQMKLH